MNTPVEELEKKRNSIDQSSLQDLEWAIGLNRVILQSLGLWTYPNESQLRTALSHIHLGLIGVCMCFLIVPQTMAMFKVLSVPMLIVDNVGHNLPFLSAEFKLGLLWYNKKDVAHIFALIREDWLMEKTSYERDVMIEYAELYKMLTIGGLLSSLATTTMYHLPITWNTVSRNLNNITDIPGALFAAQSVYPYDVTQPMAYRLTALSQYIAEVSASLTYTGIDVLFSLVILHLCGQLKILAHKIETMTDDRQNFQKNLKINAQRHCALIKYTEEIEDIFSMMVLSLIVLFSIIFCLESFTLISVSSDTTQIPVSQFTFYILFTGYFLMLMFLYSWVGEKLVEHGQLLREAVYNCDWTSLTAREFWQITFILIRTEKPLCITAGKFAPMTLSTFLSIVRTSCGWLSVLLAMET